VAALFEAGNGLKEILEMYPSSEESQIELASIYAKAVPQRGRPKRMQFPTGTKVVSVTSGRLKETNVN
jgi:hypothetical protein